MKFLSSRTIVANLAALPVAYSVAQILLDKASAILPALITNPVVLAVVTALLPIVNMWLRTKTTVPLDQRPNFEFVTSEAKFPVINQ
jgi:hypothetical protein